MADALTRELEESNRALVRTSNRLAQHAHAIKSGGMQVASALEGIGGAAMAAAADAMFGTTPNPGQTIPELYVGPVPVVPVAGLLLKLCAIGCHVAGKGRESYETAADHLGNLADGVLAGSAALMTARIVAELKAGQSPSV